MDAPEKRRWYYLTPGWLVLGSLAVTGLLWLSNWLGWPAWHEGYAVLAAVAGVGLVLVAMLLWWLAALVFRCRFQFGIRTLLVLTLAVALPCGWLGVKMWEASRQREAVKLITKANGQVWYDYQFDKDGIPIKSAALPVSQWLRSLLGDDFFQTAIEASAGNDTALQQVANLPSLRVLNAQTGPGGWVSRHERLEEFPFLDQAMAPMTAEEQKRWDSLVKKYPPSSDAGLASLKGLTGLKELNLTSTDITDAGLAYLEGLPNLERLWLELTRVTPGGLVHLRGLSKLRRLYLPIDYTGKELEQVHKMLPNCEVYQRLAIEAVYENPLARHGGN